MFRRGKRNKRVKYEPLDYVGGYTFSLGVAYGQLNQVLDLAATDTKRSKELMQVADRWIKVIKNLDRESGPNPPPPIGFFINDQGEDEDDVESQS